MSRQKLDGLYLREMDGIIFDVDGTLWDSTEPVSKAWNNALQKNTNLDLRLDAKRLSELFGKTMTEIADLLLPSYPQEERMPILQYCYTYENEYLETHPGTIYDQVPEVFRTLAEKTNLYIVSNCQCGYIETFLKASGLGSYIKDHLCFGETLVSKGQTIRILMEHNGLKRAVYVGDTQGDADACMEAAIPFIFTRYGFGTVPDARWQIDRFSDLLELLD